MSISIDEDLAKDLVQHKILDIDKRIQKILKRWEFSNIDDFVEASRLGKLDEDSIDDALDIQNLIDKRDEITSILQK